MDLPRITYPITLNGRTFSVEELGVIRSLTTDCAGLARTELAYSLCELLDWRRPTGKLKNHEGRLLLEHLATKDLVALPTVRGTWARPGPRTPPRSSRSSSAWWDWAGDRPSWTACARRGRACCWSAFWWRSRHTSWRCSS